MSLKILLLALPILAACAKPVPVVENVSQDVPKMPRGIVWTDGNAPVRVSTSGIAHCGALSPSEAARALAQTNAARAQSGLPALRINPLVQRAAQEHSCDMARRGTMTHTGTTTSGPSARVKAQGYRTSLTAENIAAGSTGLFTLDKTMSQWSTSPGHRANIMIARLEEFGVGRALSADGRTAFWTAIYTDPR